MKSFNLFKLVVWLFKSIANHAIFLYKWSRLHLRKLTSHITTKVNGPHKNDDEYYRVNDDDDDDYEEDEYDTTCSSSSGDEDQETCRQRKTNKKDTGDRNSEEKQSEDKMSKAVIGRRLRMKKELVLDLDETLVHSTTEWAVSYHFTVTVKLPCGVLSGESDVLRTSERSSGEQGAASDDMYPAVFYVTKRPYLDVFLKKVSKWYNLSIFTSSLRVYAEPVINEIDTRHLIKRRFYRDSCSDFGDGIVQKDLSVLNTDLSKVILVDNCAEWFSRYKENALPIPSWTGDNQRDEGLLDLLPVLNALRYVNDVRSILCLRTFSD